MTSTSEAVASLSEVGSKAESNRAAVATAVAAALRDDEVAVTGKRPREETGGSSGQPAAHKAHWDALGDLGGMDSEEEEEEEA